MFSFTQWKQQNTAGKISDIAIIISPVLILIGYFLPWASISTSSSLFRIDDPTLETAPIMLFLGITMAIGAIMSLFPKYRRWKIVVGIAAIAVLGFGLFNVGNALNAINEAKNFGGSFTGSLGLAVYLVLAGGVLGLAGFAGLFNLGEKAEKSAGIRMAARPAFYPPGNQVIMNVSDNYFINILYIYFNNNLGKRMSQQYIDALSADLSNLTEGQKAFLEVQVKPVRSQIKNALYFQMVSINPSPAFWRSSLSQYPRSTITAMASEIIAEMPGY